MPVRPLQELAAAREKSGVLTAHHERAIAERGDKVRAIRCAAVGALLVGLTEAAIPNTLARAHISESPCRTRSSLTPARPSRPRSSATRPSARSWTRSRWGDGDEVEVTDTVTPCKCASHHVHRTRRHAPPTHPGTPQTALAAHRDARRRTDAEARLDSALEELKRVLPGVRGRLVELVTPASKKYGLSVSIALGKYMDAVVVDNMDTAFQAIRWLRENKVW